MLPITQGILLGKYVTKRFSVNLKFANLTFYFSLATISIVTTRKIALKPNNLTVVKPDVASLILSDSGL